MGSPDAYRDNVKNVLDASRLYLRLKGVGEWAESYKTVKYYGIALDRAIKDFYDGSMDEGEFIDEMIRLIEGQFGRAWNEGAREVGFDIKRMRDADKAALQGRIDKELEFILDFAQQIDNAAAEGKPVDPFRQRVKLWTNRYNEIVNDAKMRFGGKKRLEWVYGDTQHCATCERLNGIVATASAWNKSGYHPQAAPNDKLDCGGWNCQCNLVPTDKRSTRGGIPRLSSVKEFIKQEVLIKLMGGEGSGNFGHAGRPGEVGGSASGLSSLSISELRRMKLLGVRDTRQYDDNGEVIPTTSSEREHCDICKTPIEIVYDIDCDGMKGGIGRECYRKYTNKKLSNIEEHTEMAKTIGLKFGEEYYSKLPSKNEWVNMSFDERLQFSNNIKNLINDRLFASGLGTIDQNGKIFSKYTDIATNEYFRRSNELSKNI